MKLLEYRSISSPPSFLKFYLQINRLEGDVESLKSETKFLRAQIGQNKGREDKEREIRGQVQEMNAWISISKLLSTSVNGDRRGI